MDKFDFNLIQNLMDRKMALDETKTYQHVAKRQAADYIDNGERLKRIRKVIPHGYWESYCRSELEMSPQHANTYILLADRLSSHKSNLRFDLELGFLKSLGRLDQDEIAKVVEQINLGLPPSKEEIDDKLKAKKQGSKNSGTLAETSTDATTTGGSVSPTEAPNQTEPTPPEAEVVANVSQGETGDDVPENAACETGDDEVQAGGSISNAAACLEAPSSIAVMPEHMPLSEPQAADADVPEPAIDEGLTLTVEMVLDDEIKVGETEGNISLLSVVKPEAEGDVVEHGASNDKQDTERRAKIFAVLVESLEFLINDGNPGDAVRTLHAKLSPAEHDECFEHLLKLITGIEHGVQGGTLYLFGEAA